MSGESIPLVVNVSSTELTCNVNNADIEVSTIVWKRKDQVLNNTEKYMITKANDSHSSTIKINKPGKFVLNCQTEVCLKFMVDAILKFVLSWWLMPACWGMGTRFWNDPYKMGWPFEGLMFALWWLKYKKSLWKTSGCHPLVRVAAQPSCVWKINLCISAYEIPHSYQNVNRSMVYFRQIFDASRLVKNMAESIAWSHLMLT